MRIHVSFYYPIETVKWGIGFKKEKKKIKRQRLKDKD